MKEIIRLPLVRNTFGNHCNRYDEKRQYRCDFLYYNQDGSVDCGIFRRTLDQDLEHEATFTKGVQSWTVKRNLMIRHPLCLAEDSRAIAVKDTEEEKKVREFLKK